MPLAFILTHENRNVVIWPFHEPNLTRTDQYNLFQNGRHFRILLCSCQSPLLVSLLNVKFKRILTTAKGPINNQTKKILKWRPLWKKGDNEKYIFKMTFGV